MEQHDGVVCHKGMPNAFFQNGQKSISTVQGERCRGPWNLNIRRHAEYKEKKMSEWANLIFRLRQFREDHELSKIALFRYILHRDLSRDFFKNIQLGDNCSSPEF
jgi:subtilisin-like proprotein convertase family protein